MTIAGRAVTVTQAAPAASCSIVLTPETQSLNSKKYDGTILVAVGSGCSWTANSSAAWLTVTGVSVAGSTVAFSIARNGTGAPRTATITVGTVTATITQRVDTLPNPVTGFHVVQ
jgi:hypothetical protein